MPDLTNLQSISKEMKGFTVRRSPLGYPELVATTAAMERLMGADTQEKKDRITGLRAITLPAEWYRSRSSLDHARQAAPPEGLPVVIYNGQPRPIDEAHERMHVGQLMTFRKPGVPSEPVPFKEFAPAGDLLAAASASAAARSLSPFYQMEMPAYGFTGPDVSPEGREAKKRAYRLYADSIARHYPDTKQYLEAHAPEWLEEDYLRTTPPPPPRARINMQPVPSSVFDPAFWKGK